MLIAHPPVIQPQLKHRQRLRFTCTTAQNQANISFRNILDGINIATTAATAYQLFDQVKIHAVEVWAAPVQGAAPAVVSVAFGGQTLGALGDGRVWGDSSMGVEPAHVRAVPQRQSQAAQWQVSGASVALELTCPVAAVIDVDVSFRTVPAISPAAVQNVPAAATVGQLYYRGLDGLAAAATQLPTALFPPD